MGDSPFSSTTSTSVTDKTLDELVQVFAERAARYDRSFLRQTARRADGL